MNKNQKRIGWTAKLYVSAGLIVALIAGSVSLASFAEMEHTENVFGVKAEGKRVRTQATPSQAEEFLPSLLSASLSDRKSLQELLEQEADNGDAIIPTWFQVSLNGIAIADSDHWNVTLKENQKIKSNTAVKHQLKVTIYPQAYGLGAGDSVSWNLGRIEGLSLDREFWEELVLSGGVHVGDVMLCYTENSNVILYTEFEEAVKRYSSITITYWYECGFIPVDEPTCIEFDLPGYDEPIPAVLLPEKETTAETDEPTTEESRPQETTEAESSIEESSSQETTEAESSTEESSPQETTEAECSTEESSPQETTEAESSTEESSKQETTEVEAPTEESSSQATTEAEPATEESSSQATTEAESATEESSQQETTEATNPSKDYDSGGNSSSYREKTTLAKETTAVPVTIPESMAETETATDPQSEELEESQAQKQDLLNDQAAEDATESNEVLDINISFGAEVTASHGTQSRVLPNEILTYRMVLHNDSEEEIKDVRIRDYLPERTSFVSVGDEGIYGVVDGQQYITWILKGLLPGEEKELTFQVKVFLCTPPDFPVRNQVYWQADDSRSVNSQERPENQVDFPMVTIE
ncbi:Translation initiation factor IF-2 [Clostridium sp. C105KSO15]|nr:Translation initiation factor IF-2 [Clostridium sp. C105KSO15]